MAQFSKRWSSFAIGYTFWRGVASPGASDACTRAGLPNATVGADKRFGTGVRGQGVQRGRGARGDTETLGQAQKIDLGSKNGYLRYSRLRTWIQSNEFIIARVILPSRATTSSRYHNQHNQTDSYIKVVLKRLYWHPHSHSDSRQHVVTNMYKFDSHQFS